MTITIKKKKINNTTSRIICNKFHCCRMCNHQGISNQVTIEKETLGIVLEKRKRYFCKLLLQLEEGLLNNLPLCKNINMMEISGHIVCYLVHLLPWKIRHKKNSLPPIITYEDDQRSQ